MSEIDVKRSFKIEDLEDIMLSMPQEECLLEHKFQPGYYIRELHMKAGTIAVGHVQNFSQLNIFVKGKVLMVAEDGSKFELSAPMTFVGNPGRKVGYVLEDVIWQNVYPTNETDIDILEATYLTKSDIFLEYAAHKFAIESNSKEVDRIDYQDAIKQLGYTEERVQFEVQNIEDRLDIELNKVRKDLSPIHGEGIFAINSILKNEVIGPSKINGKRTQLGRFINHSKNPNCVMQRIDNTDNIYVIANEDLVGCLGGMQGTELTVDYREVRKLLEN